MSKEVTVETFSSAILTTVIAIICTLIWFLTKNYKKSSKEIAPFPPGPRGFPLLGYLPFLGTNLHKKFTKLAEDYGPIYSLRLGSKLCVVISSPPLAKEILRNQDKIFANRDPPIVVKVAAFGGKDIVWSDCGTEWKMLRKLFVREMMSNASIDSCYGLRRQEVRKATREVFHKSGKPINIGELAFLMNLNAIMSMLWGATLEGDEGIQMGLKFKTIVADLMVTVGKPNISDFLPVLAPFDLQGVERQAKKFAVAFEKFLDSAIKRCEALIEASKAGKGEQNERRKDFLRHMLELRDEDGATSISSTQLKVLLEDIVIGGADTTSTMVEWTLAELMHHQEIMKKVHQELDEVVGLNNTVHESHLPKLRYLDAVVKETFRLHPAVPLLIPRCPRTTSTVGGYSIPKGSIVFMNVYAIHRDPGIWESPLEFRPERFLNGETNKIDFSGNNFQYLPFGSGRRVCAGLPLAEKMLTYQLAYLLHSFEWNLPAESKLDLSDKFGIVVKKAEPLIGIPTPKLANLDLY